MIALSSALSLALALVLGSPTWQEPEAEGPAPEDLQPKLAQLDGEIAIIPFTLDGGRPVPLIEAKVNGKGPFLFFYDTGASVCILDTGFVEELGLESLGTTEVGDHTANARIPAERVEMATLELAGMRFESVPALAFDRSRLRGAEIRGVLGLPLFHDHLLTLDYQKGQMEISRQTLTEQGLGVVPYGGGLLPEMMISVGGKEISCHLDSGSPTGLMLPTSFVEDQAHKSEPTKVGEARTVNSVLEIWSVQLDATAVIAGTEFTDPVVVYNEMIPNALIGYQTLKDMVLTIDQRSKLLRLLPTDTYADHEKVERAVLDYAESYYEVKPEYVERSIHSDLAKIGYVEKGESWEAHPMDYAGFMAMVQWFVQSEQVPEPGPKEVVVLAMTDQTALVQLTGSWGIDYMHLARFDGRWQTRHAVWQSMPKSRPAAAIEQDRASVEQTALSYLAAMSNSQPELLDQCVHADVVEFGFTGRDPEASEATEEATGHAQVLGVMDRVACVELTAPWGVEYLNLVLGEDGKWRIRHILSHFDS